MYQAVLFLLVSLFSARNRAYPPPPVPMINPAINGPTIDGAVPGGQGPNAKIFFEYRAKEVKAAANGIALIKVVDNIDSPFWVSPSYWRKCGKEILVVYKRL